MQADLNTFSESHSWKDSFFESDKKSLFLSSTNEMQPKHRWSQNEDRQRKPIRERGGIEKITPISDWDKHAKGNQKKFSTFMPCRLGKRGALKRRPFGIATARSENMQINGAILSFVLTLLCHFCIFWPHRPKLLLFGWLHIALAVLQGVAQMSTGQGRKSIIQGNQLLRSPLSCQSKALFNAHSKSFIGSPRFYGSLWYVSVVSVHFARWWQKIVQARVARIFSCR